MNYSGKI